MCRPPRPKPIQTAPAEVLSNPLTDGRRGAMGAYFANRTGRSSLLIRRTSPNAPRAVAPDGTPAPTDTSFGRWLNSRPMTPPTPL